MVGRGMGKMKRTALLVILLLIVASSSFALTRAFKTKEEYSHFHQSQLFLQRQSDITKCLNARNLNNVINKDENLVLNDDYLIEFAKRLVNRKGMHFEKTVAQTNGSETVRLIPATLIEEICESYFNRKPSKPLSKYYDYQKYGYVSKDEEFVTLNEVNHFSFDFDNNTINLSGYVLQIPIKIYNVIRHDYNHVWFNREAINNVTCKYYFEAKVVYKDRHIDEFYFSTHEITKDEYEEFKKNYIKEGINENFQSK